MALPPHLETLRDSIEGYAREFGLDFFDVVFECVTFDEMNMIAAYGGFPTRYPHWKFGMEYERLAKGYAFGLSKIYELVINNDPSYAYLMASNADVDQKLVMAHVYGHVDFFKNNFAFAHTNRKMMDTMANHGTKIRRYIDRYGVDKVEGFVDRCLSIDNLIDYQSPYIKRREVNKEKQDRDTAIVDVPRLRADREYMRNYINPEGFIEEQRKKMEKEREQERKFPERPERDVMLFLLEHAPLETWERDVLSMMREEAYYYAPQGQTKIMNEGWACVAGDTLVYTEAGLLPMAEVVVGGAQYVSDGETKREIYGQNVIPAHETRTVRTRRGFALTGSNNHRVLLADGTTWARLDELAIGTKVALGAGPMMWPSEQMPVQWSSKHRVNLEDVAQQAGVSLLTVLRHRAGRRVGQHEAVARCLEAYDVDENQALPQSINKRIAVRVPKVIDEALAAFVGYLVGDGHISRVKRNVGLTTGDLEQAEAFAGLARQLFDVQVVHRIDGRKHRILLHSENVADFLEQAIGLTTGPSAAQKRVPAGILRSPKSVVRAFLRAYFDCDGYAGKGGVILSTVSDGLAQQTAMLLLNFGILSRRRKQKDGCWHVHVTGASAKKFAEEIGFGLARKQQALEAYVADRIWFKEERWDDEIVDVTSGTADVYDISVRDTHRYAAAGFINHNSYWHTTIMTQRALLPSEVIDYADRHAGTMGMQPGSINPYKLGLELYRDIEDRWNRGRFGKEWEECEDLARRKNWDSKAGLGRSKVFEVRRHYNDVTFIDEFLTADFAEEHKLFNYAFNKKNSNWEIASRDFRKIKTKLLAQLTNFGQPFIAVVDGNYKNRGELLLKHEHDGTDLRQDYCRDTLSNLQSIWSRPVGIKTKMDERSVIVRYDGHEYSEVDVSDE